MDVGLSWMAWVTGGLAGAALTALVNRRRARIEGSLKVIEQYFSRFKDLEFVYNLLGNSNSFVSQANPNAEDNLNRVRVLGDWLDIVAMLYVKGHINRAILDDAELTKLIRDFRAYLKDYGPPLNTFLEGWWYGKLLEGYPHGSPSKAVIAPNKGATP